MIWNVGCDMGFCLINTAMAKRGVDPQIPGVTLPRHLPNRMRAVDLIRKKRDAVEHSREEIDFLISGYTRGDVPDYQMAAWLMAVWIRGLSRAETTALTEAMLHSGEVLDLSVCRAKK